MEEHSEGKEICLVGEGSILRKLGRVLLRSTAVVDRAMHRTEQIPHGLQAGFKQILLPTEETVRPLPTTEPEVLRDLQPPGETGAVQGKGHPASRETLKVIPEPLLQVTTDLFLLL